MIVLSHRGYWRESHEKNQEVAFRRSFELGFGTETDVRDSGAELVIAHDVPRGDELKLSDVIRMLESRDLPLAVNIKSDGLGMLLKEQLGQSHLTNWFTFDMSIPELVRQIDQGLPAFTRLSDLEPEPILYQKAAGIWLDAFWSDWYSPDKLGVFVADQKQICIVSPELHRRDHMPFWQKLRSSPYCNAPGVMLCTDHPEAAQGFFGEQK